MHATTINAALLNGHCRLRGLDVDLYSRGPSLALGQEWDEHAARMSLENGRVVVVAGGMGVAGMSTDVPAVNLAVELGLDAVIMAKNGVDGVYSSDPRVDPAAVHLTTVNASEAIRQRLAVMDVTAMELALHYKKPIHVVSASAHGAFIQVVEGATLGSTICPA